jgi:transposase
MATSKLTPKDIERIIKLINEGHQMKDLAKRFGVHYTTLHNRCKALYRSRRTPVEVKNKVIQAIQKGCTKAEAAQMYGLHVATVYEFTKNMKGFKREGNHIIRPQAIKLLNRLMTDGCLINDYVVSTVRGLQKHFPMIRTARFKDKTFFYLEGREEDAIEAYFRDKPDKIINYSAIEELSYLLGVKITKDDQRNLIEKYKGKHINYWKSRWLIQRKLEDFLPEAEIALSQKEVKPMFVLFPTKEIIEG